MFNIGDKVEVFKGGLSYSSKLLAGRIGFITLISWANNEMYVRLDIETEVPHQMGGGIWAKEIMLISTFNSDWFTNKPKRNIKEILEEKYEHMYKNN